MRITPFPTENIARPMHLILCGRISYMSALTLQEHLASRRLAGTLPDTLLLLEHDPVFTAGRTTKTGDLPINSPFMKLTPVRTVQVSRGGSVTYHGPGQIVGYPILRLRDHCAGPKSYVTLLEESLIRVLADWGICGYRRERLPGVWVETAGWVKIASIGVRITQGITTHGFALNVDMDLEPFRHIVPCGISSCRVTSMAAVLNRPVAIADVMSELADHFAQLFGASWRPANEQLQNLCASHRI